MKKRKNLLHEDNWLKGKTVFITGATSGIGRELALLLSACESKVIAHGRDQNLLYSLISSAQAKYIEPVLGDLKEEIGRKVVENAIVEKKPDALILNAGFNSRKEYASGWTDSEAYDMLNVNLISPLLCARSFARLPKLSEPRRLALILSTSCHFVREKMSLYVACKTGLMGFGKVMQQEAKELGVRTVLFYPGRINTGFREKQVLEYMSSESVAQVITTILCLPDDIVPYEFTFRPEIDTHI